MKFQVKLLTKRKSYHWEKYFISERIIGSNKSRETGGNVDEICRGIGLAAGAFHNWWAKYTGMEVNKAKRLRELESVNAKLKKLQLWNY